MNVQFKSVVIKNFMSLVDETINLEDLGVVLVKGINNYDSLFKSNGSGKSAVFDSILWALTGNTSRGSSNVSNRNVTPTGAYVEVIMMIDSDEYNIIRTDGYRDKGKSITIIKNGEDISGSTLTKSKDILKQQLSFITYDILTSIIILSQGLPGRLSNLRPSDRKSRLEYLSNTDGILEEIQNKMNKANSELSGKISSCNIEIAKVNTSISSNQSTIDSCNGRIKELKTYQSTHSEVTDSDIENYRIKIDEYKKSVEAMRVKYSTLVKMESDLASKKLIINNKLSSLSSKISELMTQYKSLSDNICPTCHSVLSSADELKSHIAEELILAKKEYVTLLKDKEKLDAIVVPDSSQYNSKIGYYDSKIIELTQEVSEYTKMKASIDSYSTTIEECKLKIDDLTKELSNINKEHDELDKQINIYNYFKSVISRKFRNFLLDGVIDYLNKRLKYYSSYLFSNNQYVYLENNGNNINIRLGESYFEDLSGGEGRRVDIILQLAQRDLSRSESGFSCNLLVLDEILDYLDSDGIDSVLRMLEKESSSVNSLMIVTHKEDVNIPNDSEIIIVKGRDQLSHISR